MASASIASSVDGPSTAVMPIASRMAGKAISASFTRIKPLSSGLKYPASAPLNGPETGVRAPDHARPQAAAEIVRAECEIGTGRTEFEAHRELGRVHRRDPRRKRRRQQ